MKKLSILIVAIALLSLASMAQALDPFSWATAVQGEVILNIGSIATYPVPPLPAAPFSLGNSNGLTLGSFSTATGGTKDFAGLGVVALNGVPTDVMFPELAWGPVVWDLKDTSGNVFGIWTSDAGIHTHPNIGSVEYFNVALTGTFTPGTFFTSAGKTWNTGSLSMTFTQDGDLIGGGGRLKMDSDPSVPEASTLVGFGSALAMAGPGLVGWLRRRRA